MTKEIRFHGRGGQGTVIASILMAKAFFQAGYFVQSFPFFGVERRGAPLEAYLRFDRKKILTRTNVYTPDHVVVLDRFLLNNIDVTNGLKKGGIILINAPDSSDFKFPGFKTGTVDATKIALKHHLGTRTNPIVNTAMIGAMSKMLGMPHMDAVVIAIREEVPGSHEENINAAKKAFEEVTVLGEKNETE